MSASAAWVNLKQLQHLKRESDATTTNAYLVVVIDSEFNLLLRQQRRIYTTFIALAVLLTSSVTII